MEKPSRIEALRKKLSFHQEQMIEHEVRASEYYLMDQNPGKYREEMEKVRQHRNAITIFKRAYSFLFRQEDGESNSS
jgi:hypothetical protein